MDRRNMNWVKGFALVTCLATPLSIIASVSAFAEDTKPAATVTKKPTKAEIEAMLTKCSDEADAKGLFVKSGKGAARKAYRRDCMTKLGVKPN